MQLPSFDPRSRSTTPTASRLFSFTYGGGASGGTIFWDYKGDNTFWQARGILGIPDPSECSTTTMCLNGRLWVNGDTEVGRTNTIADGVTVGIHGNGPAERSLADYYFDEEPDVTVTEVVPGVGVLPRDRLKMVLRTPGDPGPDGREQPSWQMFERGSSICPATSTNGPPHVTNNTRAERCAESRAVRS